MLANNNIFIDYDRIRNEEGKPIVGSSKLAGFVGCYDGLRGLGEYLLTKEGINTPFLFTGSAYMQRSYQSCKDTLTQIGKDFLPIPESLRPMIFGITGRSGACTAGVLDLLSCLKVKHIKPTEVEAVT